MKLLTKELEKEFEKYPMYSQEELGGDAIVVAKFFNPIGQGTWLITEGEKDGDDFIMFGFCNLCGMDFAELGDVSIKELESIQLPLGLTIERDLHFPKNMRLGDAIMNEFGQCPDYLKSTEEIKIKGV